jgi:hypothetical protein
MRLPIKYFHRVRVFVRPPSVVSEVSSAARAMRLSAATLNVGVA